MKATTAHKRILQLHILCGLEAMFSALMHEVSLFIKVAGSALESEVSVGVLFAMGAPLFGAGLAVLLTTGRLRDGAWRLPLLAALSQLAVVGALIVIYDEPRGLPHLVLPALDIAALLGWRGRTRAETTT